MSQHPQSALPAALAGLEPELQALEQRRQRVVAWTLGGTLGVVVLLVLLAALITSAPRTMPPWLLFIMIPLGLILCLVIYQVASQGYRHAFKEQIIRRIIASVDPSLAYSPEGSIDQGTFMSSLLFTRSPDRFQGEDL